MTAISSLLKGIQYMQGNDNKFNNYEESVSIIIHYKHSFNKL